MFFKLLDDNTLTFGPYVHSAEYMLIEEFHNQYQLPIDGWHYFETEDAAKVFFNIQEDENAT